MSAFDEVVIDEVRFPRMFGSMRRAGMYRRCGCAGCPPCRNAAQRLLRGIARNPQSSAPYRPERWGNRYRMLSRNIGRRRVNVLADMDGAAPTVVDVAVGDAPNASGVDDAAVVDPPMADADTSQVASDEPAEELDLQSLLARKIPKTLKTRDNTQLVRDVLIAKGIAVASPAGKPMILSKPVSVAALSAPGGLNALPNGPGVYLAQWGNGQYFGKANHLRSRISEHLEAINRYVWSPSQFRFYVLPIQGDPRPVEKQVLTALSDLVGTGKETVAARFRLLGMTNKQREFEFF
jgi:hypothetical protein